MWRARDIACLRPRSPTAKKSACRFTGAGLRRDAASGGLTESGVHLAASSSSATLPTCGEFCYWRGWLCSGLSTAVLAHGHGWESRWAWQLGSLSTRLHYCSPSKTSTGRRVDGRASPSRCRSSESPAAVSSLRAVARKTVTPNDHGHEVPAEVYRLVRRLRPDPSLVTKVIQFRRYRPFGSLEGSKAISRSFPYPPCAEIQCQHG